MAIQTRQIVWIDVGGRTRVTQPTANPDSSTIMAKLQLHSNADVLNWFEGPQNLLTPTPVLAAYPDVADIARLTFADASGNLVDLALLAPQQAIFLADSVTVDQSAIADIVTAAIGTLVSSAGNPVVSFVGGLRGIRASGS